MKNVTPSLSPTAAATTTVEYDDNYVRKFMIASIFWGLVGLGVGVLIATQLNYWQMNGKFLEWITFGLIQSEGVQFLTFGRLRPLHTNAAIFAFVGNMMFAGVYYSTQRLCRARMASDLLTKINFWGWQLIIVLAAVTLPAGYTRGKEYAELIWPINILVAVIWLVFAANFFWTLAKRREKSLYVGLWFYIATIVTVTMLYVVNHLSLPTSFTHSYPIFGGVQDALVQWWYGHNAVAFFLTTPMLGIMYYFVPKSVDRPVYSYRLSIIHFWSLVFIYIWAGPHHLLNTALPEWLQSLGMLFSLMLWAPSWAGMLNGLLTLRGAWDRLRTDYILKMMVVAVSFYGMSTFEGPMLSIKAVNSLSHYTDWTIAHVHSGALGWNGMMSFGMLYWLLPRLFQTKLHSKKLANWHFWLGTLGILAYIVPIYVAGLTQGLMWRAFDEAGNLAYPDFVETVQAIEPMWWARVFGGAMYIAGILLLAYNWFMTWKTRPSKYEEPVIEAAPLSKDYVDPPKPRSNYEGHAVAGIGQKLDIWTQAHWHRIWERLPMKFTVMTTFAVLLASGLELIPSFLIRSNVPTISTVKPYTPLELAGRDIYVQEGCYNCHSQMIRPIFAETERYGEYSKPGEFVYDRPFQWGSRRIGPDLAREGGKQSHLWHLRHLRDPQGTTKGSAMPDYAHLERTALNFGAIHDRVEAAAALGAPYEAELMEGEDMARAQAKEIVAELVAQDGPDRIFFDPADSADPAAYEDASKYIKLEETQAIALIAYLQRIGVDLHATEETGEEPPMVAETPAEATPARTLGGAQ